MSKMLDLDFTGGVLDGRIAFSRNSIATYFDSAGILRTAAAHTPRFDYHPITRAIRGLLIEEGRTNLLVRSQELDNASWTKEDITITANAAMAPDGTLTADLATEGTAGTAAISQDGITVTSGVDYALSFLLKKNNQDIVRVTGFNSGSDTFRCWVNLNTGAVLSGSATGTATYISSSIEATLDGWYRVTLVGRVAATSMYVALCSASADGSTTRVNNARYYAWAGQLELGAFATSYIPTVGSTVTRAADSAQMTGTNFSSWFNPAAGTIYVEGDIIDDGDTRDLISLDDDTGDERIEFRAAQSDSNVLFDIVDGGVGQCAISLARSALSDIKMAAAYSADDFQLAYNGTLGTSDTSGSLPTVAKMRIGTSVFTNSLNGWIRKIKFWNERVSNTQLQRYSIGDFRDIVAALSPRTLHDIMADTQE